METELRCSTSTARGESSAAAFHPGKRFTRPTLDLDDSMARSRIKSGGPNRGRLRVLKMGMGSGKILAKGRVKKPKRGRGRS